MSEFGRGYATCLIQFVNHRARLAEDVAAYADLNRKYPGDFGPGRVAELWANGASDHLYELVRPRGGITKVDWQAARVMADRALDIGHGFLATRKGTPAECRELLDEAARLLPAGVASLTDALAWDEAHGLKPERGEWSCAENLQRRALA